jgi:hypothetical protein
MRRARSLLLLGGAAALLVALAGVAWVALSRAAGAPVSSGPLAVVLLPDLSGSRLVVVDLARHSIVRRVRLRSLVTDIDADPGTGLVVGAQSGGVGDRADDAVSLVDPWSGLVRYVRLPWRDPALVECIAGRAFVLHSIVQTQGLTCSVVDIASGSVVATGHAPDGPGVWTAAAGHVWTVGLGASGASSLVGIDPTTLATDVVPSIGMTPRAVEEASGTVAVLGSDTTDVPSAQSRIVLLDARSSVTASAAVPGLSHVARVAAVAGRWLVVGDWSGEEPETRRLEVFDRDTLAHRGSIEVDGVPCALAASGGRLLAVDRVGGRLLDIEPATGAVAGVVDLGERDLIYAEIAVIPSSADSGTR